MRHEDDVARQVFRAAWVGHVQQVARRAPVQDYDGTIPWALHLEAYEVYCKRYRPQPRLIEGNCRGGFSAGELDDFIPGWRARVSVAAVGRPGDEGRVCSAFVKFIEATGVAPGAAGATAFIQATLPLIADQMATSGT
jgi:hypothetical protein